MKITFDDKSFVTCYISDDGSKVIISISASDRSDKLKKTTNSVELTLDEFKTLVSDIK